MATRLRVLLVEDSEDDAELVLNAIRHGGYEPVAERVDTEPAMAVALAAQPWDLVISDHSMPRFSSGAALELVRRSGSDAPFLIVSGTIGEEVAVAAMKSGAHDYILKGNLARLVPAIARELSDAEARRARTRAETRTLALLEISRSIAGTLNLDALLGATQPRIAAALPCDVVATLFLDPVRKALE